MTDTFDPASRKIHDQAAQWLARRHSGAWKRRDQADLDRWLNANPAHRHAYQQASRLWEDLNSASHAMAGLRTAAKNYRPALRENTARYKWATTGAAITLLVVTVIAYRHWLGFESRYVTAKGETKEIVLADGSTIRLNTDSELKVRFNAGQRNVELLRGEVMFNVVHNAAWPFNVNAGAGRIEDIGTRFDVYTQTDQVAVNVLEGSVEIANLQKDAPLTVLTAGEAAAYDAQGQLLPGFQSDVHSATAWLEGIVVFNETPLPQVVEQLSRYHPVKFQLAGKNLSGIKISGRFQAANLALFLKTLQSGFPVKVSWLDDEHVQLLIL